MLFRVTLLVGYLDFESRRRRFDSCTRSVNERHQVTKHVESRSFEELIDNATDLAYNDLRMIKALVDLRKKQGMTTKDVADALGIKESKIKKFERHDADPRLSTIRRYALVVGAKIQHDVEGL